MAVREPPITITEEAGWLPESLPLSSEKRVGDLPQPILTRR